MSARATWNRRVESDLRRATTLAENALAARDRKQAALALLDDSADPGIGPVRRQMQKDLQVLNRRVSITQAQLQRANRKTYEALTSAEQAVVERLFTLLPVTKMEDVACCGPDLLAVQRIVDSTIDALGRSVTEDEERDLFKQACLMAMSENE